MTNPITDIPDLHGEMWIPFAPTPKGRPRLSKYGGAFTPRRTREAEHFIREFVSAHESIREPLDYPLAISVRFFFKAKETSYRSDKPDILSLAHLVVEALGPRVYTYLGEKTIRTGLLYKKENQICSIMVDKFNHCEQGIWVRWKTMTYPFTVVHPLERGND
jgi:Holliday junction resolvase RusA-like endonuclease